VATINLADFSIPRQFVYESTLSQNNILVKVILVKSLITKGYYLVIHKGKSGRGGTLALPEQEQADNLLENLTGQVEARLFELGWEPYEYRHTTPVMKFKEYTYWLPSK
jgi:hypothetical protein